MYDSATTALAQVVSASGGELRELDPDIVRPGWVALGIFLLMVLALVLLMWSFVRMSRRAREPWPGEDADPGGSVEQNSER